jgi:hypothetical protein
MVLTARKPPWVGHIEYPNGGRPSVGFARGGGPGSVGSLFDERFGTWDIWRDTVPVEQIECEPQIGRGLDGNQGVFTSYFVHPRETLSAGNFTGDNVGWKSVIPPSFDESPSSPSYILRYGIRTLELATKYIPARALDGSTPTPDGDYSGRSKAYQALLRSWFHQNPDLWSGQIVMPGRTDCRVGKRLLHLNGGQGGRAREYYITSVSHSMNFDQGGGFTTAVGVSRGQDVNL